jgi:xanthine/CO dehydrogenase XdhC/CoxF family maturation factor
VIHNDAPYESLPDGAEIHFVGAIAGGAGAPAGVHDGGYPVDPLIRAFDWVRAGRAVAVATVLETWGSSPCPPGSRLVVDEAGHFEGSVSGGCVEGAVIEQAAQVIADGRPATLEFGVADEDAWAVGLACGGRVRIYLERVD